MGHGFTGCGKITLRGVILSAAKDLLFAMLKIKQILQSRKTGATSG